MHSSLLVFSSLLVSSFPLQCCAADESDQLISPSADIKVSIHLVGRNLGDGVQGYLMWAQIDMYCTVPIDPLAR